MVPQKITIAIAIALTSMCANAQEIPEEAPKVSAGLYVTVTQNEVYIIKDGKEFDVRTGETAWVGEDSVELLRTSAKFLNWPCGETGTQDSVLKPSYTLDTLAAENRIEQIIVRFFEDYEIPDPVPSWINRESHASFPADEIDRYTTEAYWYKPGKATPKMEAMRPKVLLMSLYPATKQVVVDPNHFEELRESYGSDPITVTFVFNAKNVIPISYFGNNVTVKKIADLFFKRGVTVAEVPMWYAGDRHFAASVKELELMFEIPALEDIEADRLAILVADLQANGFTKKPINVAVIAQNSTMVIDEADKVRAAQSIGMDSIPIVFFYYDEDTVKRRCGLVETGGSGAAAGLEGSTDTSGSTGTPVSPPEKPASGN
jgi:hypothetical protein